MVAGLGIRVRWTPHLVIVAIRDNKGYVRVLLYSYYTTITGWGVLLRLGFEGWSLRNDGLFILEQQGSI